MSSPGRIARAALVPPVVIVGGLALLPVAAAADLPLASAAGAVVLLSLVAAAYPRVLNWPALVGLLILVILFIPIRRYVLPGDLPFQLEPYRVLVAGLAFLWISALLVDRRVRLAKTGMEGPLLLFLAAVLASIFLNSSRIAELGVETDALKALTFLLSFMLVFFLVASVIRTTIEVDVLVKLLVAGGVVIAVLAVVESRSGYNPFNQLTSIAPFLQEIREPGLLERGRFRARGPAEHPIALSAALVMLVPLGIYLTHVTRRIRWALATGLLMVGVFTSVSRTGVVMLLTVGAVFFWLRRPETKRVLPLLLPLLAAVHFAVPGTLGTLRASFFPEGGLIEEQRGYQDTGRIGDLGPTLSRSAEEPLGIGYGTRIVSGPRRNESILDNQWLATLLETGVIGIAAWVWFFARLIRRLAAEARRDLTERGWLVVAIAAALTAYAIGMFTYDAFGFVQVTFLLYILAGLGVALTVARPSARGAAA